MTLDEYATGQQAIASAWKKRTPTLLGFARESAPWINQDGSPVGFYTHCLPRESAASNLLPGNHGAIGLFAELEIPWHCGINEGPGNNLLSSQVQCVNALMPMVNDPQRIIRAFGDLLDIAEVLEIEPNRYLTFEYIGPTDYFNEGAGQPRVRGAKCTSLDAAFLYSTSAGTTELALIEWKYTEKYNRMRKPNIRYDQTRINRYGPDYHDPSGPLRSDLIDIKWMLDEPFYQLMRQQLLAWRLEQDRAEGAAVVRILHVLPPTNDAYQASLVRHDRQLGDSVDAVWSKLLHSPDRFIHVNPEVFLDESITSWDYIDRYSPADTHDLPWGVAVWRRDGRIVAAAYVEEDSFEWCQSRTTIERPTDRTQLAAIPDREYFALADDERTMIVGPRQFARAFLRAVVATGLTQPDTLTCCSWPNNTEELISAWPPLELGFRNGF
ncbi:PGN_0703 family putative restriction endonuclease [Aeromicrobium sp. CF3.5]|uniref:PGN_0703 family putative restriction endonuclease n=1 Tax=Aeromicrobium sp. CF3.5 TaxID=3373078 RepID=UPI003EE6C3A6